MESGEEPRRAKLESKALGESENLNYAKAKTKLLLSSTGVEGCCGLMLIDPLKHDVCRKPPVQGEGRMQRFQTIGGEAAYYA